MTFSFAEQDYDSAVTDRGLQSKAFSPKDKLRIPIIGLLFPIRIVKNQYKYKQYFLLFLHVYKLLINK